MPAKHFSANTHSKSIVPKGLKQAKAFASSQVAFSRNSKAQAVASRDEMNLAEFPLAVLSTRVNPKIKTLEFSDHYRKPNGELVERKWIITGADKFGLPTSTDDDVVLGLIRLTMNRGFRDRKVYFTRYELLKILRWSTEGRSYSRLIKSLDRLSGVRIRSTNSFYDNASKSYQTCNFGVIDAYEINDHRGGKKVRGAEAPKSYFVWSELLFDSFKAGFIKKLDLDLYFTLSSAISRRLYRYLDKHFYYKSSLEMSLTVLAFEKLGLSRNYKYVSSIKQQLEPALEELTTVGFLSSYDYRGRGDQTTICIGLRSAASVRGMSSEIPSEEQRKTASPVSFLQGLHQLLFKELCSRGIAEAQAHRLLEKKSESDCEKIRAILKYYDFLVSKSDHKVSKNPVGFLYRAVETLYAVPEAFSASARAVATTSASSSQRNPRARPELRIFSAKSDVKGKVLDTSKASGEEETLLRASYRAFCESETSQILNKMSPAELSAVSRTVEGKMQCLKSVLEPKRFDEAISGCVRDEIMKRSGIPDFATWRSGQGRN